jgi:hypothetical protein
MMDIEIKTYKELLNPGGIEKGYFDFEEDFIEENVRCIPMMVRFKMDKAGIKLKLKQWSRFTTDERVALALKPCNTPNDIHDFHAYLAALVWKHTGEVATPLEIDEQPQWAIGDTVPHQLVDKAREHDCTISADQWNQLSYLQRFALLKLQRPGHENKNFPIALQEFGLK